jgi:hypothetical protein
MEVSMDKEEYVTAIHKSIWEELDKKVQSKYGKSIAQLFGEETQIIERTLSHLITEMMQREIFPEDIKYDLVKVYTEMKIGNLWDKSLRELEENYQTAMFGITLLTLLSVGEFYVTVMWNLIEFLLKARENQA